MHVRTRLPILLLAVVAASTVAPGCRPERPEGRVQAAPSPVVRSERSRDWVVARIGDRDIPFGELEDVLDALPVFARMRYQTPEKRRDFLEAYVQFVILGLAAEADGAGKDPVVLERLKADLVDRFLQERIDLKVRSTDIPEDRIREWYDRHPWESKAPARKRLAHLRVQDRVLADKLAFRIRKRLDAASGDPVEDFGRYVREHSDDVATRDRGGDLGLFPRVGGEVQGVPDAVVEAGLKLVDLFQVSPMIEAPDGFHVLMLTGQVPPIDETLEQARPRIVGRLMDDERARLRDALLADLAKRSGVVVDSAVADRVEAEVAAEQAAVNADAGAIAAPGGAP